MGKIKETAIIKTTYDAQAQEIIRLHSEIEASLRTTLAKAIRIGQLLSEKKTTLKHGEYLPYVRTLPFSERTARMYVSVYKRQDELKSAKVADLSNAYQFLGLLPGETKESADSDILIVRTDSIEANPFFDIGKIPGPSIEWWVNVLKQDICQPIPYWTLTVRRHGNKYQLVCDHDRWAAMRLAGTKEAKVTVRNLTDELMKSTIDLFDNKWYQDYRKYLAQEDEDIDF